ncbi:hypothetical protein Pcinc_024117 [Petrolisthes cinctipes]|uniref:Translation initiation factor eIF2B subunit gamma n=1 Tax=Petrolisthes cinctipes TaxID=88211 RepID=A0AAE1FB07_PETCI|nr:hypothetical protein Pcinc_024117 [Petrolisthes cinctipes]
MPNKLLDLFHGSPENLQAASVEIKMRPEVQAVVLAAGPGMRMTALTATSPKCLLPLATLPMLAFPLHLLQRAGLEEATVVVAAGEEVRVSKVVEQCGLTINVDSAPVNTSTDPGTADSLRHILHKIKRNVDDVVIVSSDLVTDVKLQDVLDFHRAHGSTLTALTAPLTPPQHQPAPGPRTKPFTSSDVMVTESESGRLVLVVAGGDYDHTLTLPSVRSSKAPLLVSTSLLDAHLYIVKRSILEQCLAKESACQDMGSFKAEILPYIVSRQFQPHNKETGPDEDFESLVSQYNTSVVVSRHHTSASFSAITCYAYKHQGLCVRVNTIPTYWDINRRMYSLIDKVLPGLSEPRRHPSAQIHEKAQVSEDSVVGAGTLVSEKTNITSCVLASHCRVDPMARLSNSVLAHHTAITSGCVVENSLVRASLNHKCVLKNCIVTDSSRIQEGKTYINEILEATPEFV